MTSPTTAVYVGDWSAGSLNASRADDATLIRVFGFATALSVIIASLFVLIGVLRRADTRARHRQVVPPPGWDLVQRDHRVTFGMVVIALAPVWVAYVAAALFAPELLFESHPVHPPHFVFLEVVALSPLAIAICACEALLSPRYFEGIVVGVLHFEVPVVGLRFDGRTSLPRVRFKIEGRVFTTSATKTPGLRDGALVRMLVGGFFDGVIHRFEIEPKP